MISRKRLLPSDKTMEIAHNNSTLNTGYTKDEDADGISCLESIRLFFTRCGIIISLGLPKNHIDKGYDEDNYPITGPDYDAMGKVWNAKGGSPSEGDIREFLENNPEIVSILNDQCPLNKSSDLNDKSSEFLQMVRDYLKENPSMKIDKFQQKFRITTGGKTRRRRRSKKTIRRKSRRNRKSKRSKR